MTVITKAFIQEQAAIVLEQCRTKLAAESWAIKPTSVEIKKMCSKYGEAFSCGKIRISSAFIGTTSYRKLDATLRHEYAHLAAGTHQNHNRNFWTFFDLFDGLIECPQEEIEQIKANIPYKWSVSVILEDGNKKHLGGVMKKSKRYDDYNLRTPEEKKHRHRDTGLRITKYVFEPFQFAE